MMTSPDKDSPDSLGLLLTKIKQIPDYHLYGRVTAVQGMLVEVGGVQRRLSLQEVGDAATGRSKGLQRAAGLLDQLDEIRHGLLVGGLSRHSLLDLARSVREQRATIGDPRLAEVLDEIELRAEVELAKYSLKG